MFFLINNEKKFILGWSAKCACYTIKRWFTELSKIDTGYYSIHQVLGYGNTPWSRIDVHQRDMYTEYKKFMLIRDPYKRLVSGYIHKYVQIEEFRTRGWNNFEEFVSLLEEDRRFEKIEKHHFAPQTSEEFYKAILTRWAWDVVLNVDSLKEDMKKVNELLQVDIDLHHHNRLVYDEENSTDKPAYLMNNGELVRHVPRYEYFYNPSICEKVKRIYDQDFRYFKKLGYEFRDPTRPS